MYKEDIENILQNKGRFHLSKFFFICFGNVSSLGSLVVDQGHSFQESIKQKIQTQQQIRSQAHK